MVLPATEDAWVTGELLLLHDPPATLRLLDSYEGCGPSDPAPYEFERHIVPVVLAAGQTVEAWAYIYNRPTAGRQPVPSGDYLHSR